MYAKISAYARSTEGTNLHILDRRDTEPATPSRDAASNFKTATTESAEKAEQTATPRQDTARFDSYHTGTAASVASEQVTIEYFKRQPQPQWGLDELFSNHLRLKSMLEQMKRFDARAAAERAAIQNKFRLQAKKSYSVMDSYVKLANADSKAQIKNVMGAVRRKIGSFRQGASQGDNLERAQAQAAIASAKKLLIRGERKIKQLDEEALSKLRAKRAVARQELSRAQTIAQEANRMRRARFTSDNRIISEGMLSEMNNFARLRHYHEQDDRLKEVAGMYGGVNGYSLPFIDRAPVSVSGNHNVAPTIPPEGITEATPIDVMI